MKTGTGWALLAVTALTIVGGASLASASTLTIGTYDAGNCYMYSCGVSDTVTRWQQHYASSAFGVSGAIDINSLTYFAAEMGPADSVTYDVYLSYAANAIGSDVATPLQGNVGSGQVLFATVSFGPAMTPTFTVTGSSPFAYDPGLGDLLVDVKIAGTSIVLGGSYSFFQASYGTADTTRNWSRSDGDFANEDSGLVTEFDYDVHSQSGSAVPEPATMTLLGSALAAMYLRRRRHA